MKETFINTEAIPKPYAGAQSVHRAITLLRFVAKYNEKGGANLSKLAREVGLHVATAHRLLSALTSEGLITHDPFSKVYHLGIELFTLGSEAFQFSIRDRYRNVIEQIAQHTEDTVFLLIRSGNDVMCIDRVEGKFPIRTMTIDIGARRPLGIGAGSLSLIAFLPDEQFENIVSANEGRFCQYRNLAADDIRNLAGKARKLGYVVSKGFFHEEVTSVAVPVFDQHQELVAAITVSAINERMGSDRRGQIAALIREISTQHT